LRFSFALLFCIFVGIGAAAAPPGQMPSGRDVVSPSAFASFDPVARGSSFQIAVVLKIREGFHINAREKSADYLIATDLRADAPAGFRIGEVTYPKGELHTFSFSKTPLNVYQGKVTVRMAVTALPHAPVGAQQIPLKLRYQACSNEVCLPPVTLQVEAPVTVAASTTAARPVHPELFQSQR
jgi:thiol:disulfide interchange protein DsbD